MKTLKQIMNEAKFSPALIKKAIAIANSPKYKDYYSGAYRAIEKLKKGLEDDPRVLAALKAANESNESIKEAFKVGDFVSVNTGPHKGEKHEIIHIKDDGGYNVKLAGKSGKSAKYKLGAASAKKSQVSAWKESVDLLKFNKKEKIMKTLKQIMNEANGIKEAPGDYKKFFQATLKKFGVKSPAELDDKKKEEFFNYIAKTWDGETEGVEMWPAGYGKDDLDEFRKPKAKKKAPSSMGAAQAMAHKKNSEYKRKDKDKRNARRLSKKQHNKYEDRASAKESVKESPESLALARSRVLDYKKLYLSTLKKFGVKSPSELGDDEKEEFFNYIAKYWDGEKLRS